MKPRLLDYVVCPKDLTELKMVVWKFRPIFLSQAHKQTAEAMQCEPEKISKEVFEGVLVNHNSKLIYPIVDGIPRLLLSANNAMKAFFAKYQKRLAEELPGYALPNFEVLDAERNSANAFEHQIFACDHELSRKEKAVQIALKERLYQMVATSTKPIQNQKVLDVGLGLGSSAAAFAEENRCELVATDTSHLVDIVQKKSGSYPFFHLVQSSLMAPVFRPQSFDVAYSVGAINHLYSPKTWLSKISELPKQSGRLSVWFDEDPSYVPSIRQRMLARAEDLLRPVFSYVPQSFKSYAILGFTPLYLMHERVFVEQYADAGLFKGLKGLMALAERRLEWQARQTLSAEDVRSWLIQLGYAEINLSRASTHSGVEGLRA